MKLMVVRIHLTFALIISISLPLGATESMLQHLIHSAVHTVHHSKERFFLGRSLNNSAIRNSDLLWTDTSSPILAKTICNLM